jgi:hypothetical protein
MLLSQNKPTSLGGLNQPVGFKERLLSAFPPIKAGHLDDIFVTGGPKIYDVGFAAYGRVMEGGPFAFTEGFRDPSG